VAQAGQKTHAQVTRFSNGFWRPSVDAAGLRFLEGSNQSDLV